MRSICSNRSAVTPECLLLMTALGLMTHVAFTSQTARDKLSGNSNEPTRYAVIDLGPNFIPVAINNSNMVVSANTVWNAGTTNVLANSPIGGAKANGIDDAGEIIGQANFLYQGIDLSTGMATNLIEGHACYWPSTNANPVDLDTKIGGASSCHNGDAYAYTPGSPYSDYVSYAVGRNANGFYGVSYCHAWATAATFSSNAVPQAAAASLNSLTGTPSPGPTGPPTFVYGLSVTNWCGYCNGSASIGYGPIINGTVYTNSSYAGFSPSGVNASNFVVGSEAPNAVMAAVASGTTLAITNLGTGAAIAVNDAYITNVTGATTNVTYSPQIVGNDGSGNGMLWDQTTYDGSPTNTYIAKSLSAIVAPPSTNSYWGIVSAVGINNAGCIIGTAYRYPPVGPPDPNLHGVLLVPCQFRTDALGSSGTIQADTDSAFEAYQTQAATALKVAKWNDAFTGNTSAPALTSTFIDTDVDAVYVRISDGSHKGAGTLTGKLQISSVDSTGATVDSGNTVDLIEDPLNPGTFQTKALLLVSDETDRTYTATGFPAAGANNHRLFKTPLGSTLVATYTMATGVTAVQKMVVAPQKTVNLHAFILLAGVITPTAVISASTVQADLEIVKQRWAQCGIQVNYTVTTVTSNPTGVSASGDYLFGFADFLDGTPIAFPDECKALFAGLPGASGEICIYYVSSFQWTGDSRFAPQAISSIQKHVSSADQASGYANRILVNVANNGSPFTESHELLHILLDAEHSDYSTEFDDLTMLWHGPTSDTDSVTATKRISAQQAKDALTKTSFPQ